MNEDELTTLLDRAIGPGPEGPHLDTILREGSRAARRRRTTAVALTAAAVLAIGGTVAAVGGGGSPSTVAPATDPTPDPSLAGEPPPRDDPLGNDPNRPLVALETDGSLTLAPGVEVLRRIDNPLRVTLPSRSAAVAFTFEGRERWTVFEILVKGGGRINGSMTSAYAEDEAETFAQFARSLEASQP